MSRLIFLVVVIAVVYWLLRSYLKQSARQATPESSEEMVRCAQCGVHVPKGESIFSDGEYFCSEAHRANRSRGEK